MAVMTYRQTIDIAAAPEDVWAVHTDLGRLDEWVAEHRAFPDGVPDNVNEGTTYGQTLEAAGQNVDLAWTVVAHDEPRVLVFDGSGPAGSSETLLYELTSEERDTPMAYATSVDLPAGALGSLAAKATAPGEVDAEAALKRFKELVER